ncbi:unnamed protein product [Acanthoscelides obtectus]|uniref:Uncharacterized protein n=1 Tax=Acanthoscelides obtectus TaxID=200917 RepID=A0A9P0NZ23_ACAOB|nr:unnamed protein product [Acanthoscelides obtectus]CAK1639026.1 hypothetical protein AOBTE_LOCUS10957 [Acanthoscelides obtectus]
MVSEYTALVITREECFGVITFTFSH